MPKAKPNYRVQVYTDGETNTRPIATAHLPDRVSISIRSDWDTPFAKSAGFGQAAVSAASSGEISGILPVHSAHVWSGASPIELSIPMQFIAEENSTLEVLEPIKRLMSLAMPEKSERLNQLIPPGPTIVDDISEITSFEFKTQGENITVMIGRYLMFKRVVVSTIDVEFHNTLDREGRPLRADVNMNFNTFTTLTKQQLEEIFTR